MKPRKTININFRVTKDMKKDLDKISDLYNLNTSDLAFEGIENIIKEYN